MPCWTRDFAIAAPIPTEAPVTRATLPFQRSMLLVTLTKIKCWTADCVVTVIRVASSSKTLQSKKTVFKPAHSAQTQPRTVHVQQVSSFFLFLSIYLI